MSIRRWLTGKNLAFAAEGDEVVEKIMDGKVLDDPEPTRRRIEIHLAEVYQNGYRIVPQEE